MQRSASLAGRSHATTHSTHHAASPVPFSRVSFSHRRHAICTVHAAAEAAAPAAVDDGAVAPALTIAQDPAPAPADALAGKGKQSGQSGQRKNNKKGSEAKDNGSSSRQPDAADRILVKERSRLLLTGEAVGLTMSATPADVAVGFKGVKPLLKALKGQNHTLLFFPSTRLVKPAKLEKPEARSDQAEELQQPQPQQEAEKSAPQAEQQDKHNRPRELDLALVAVPYFQKPAPDVTIRVGAKSKPDVIARTLARSLLVSATVAVRAAGPSATLVALVAAAQARRAIGAQQQLDLAFSLEYLQLPATEAGKPPASEESSAAVTTAPEAAAPAADAVPTDAAAAAADAPVAAAAAPAVEGSEPASSSASGAKGPFSQTSVMQLTFYKRALPTPEVLVSDFAPTRAGPAMSQLLTSLISERREVDLLLDSRDALFAMQTLARVVRDSWMQSKASVGIFLTSLLPNPDNQPEESGAEQHFTARLQLRRIPGAPNLVPAGGDGRSLLGPPVGTVKWDSPVGPLAGAMGREWYSAGIFSIWPQEGVCVARALRALWQAQQERAAEAAAVVAAAGAAAEAPAAPVDGGEAAAVTPDAALAASTSSSVFQIAVIPEIQEEGAARESGNGSRPPRPREGAERTGRGRSTSSSNRSTVLHLLEVSPMLASTLRSDDGKVIPISRGEQMHQLMKAVVLRNRMYAGRQGGKILALRPVLDDGGALAMRFQYIDTAVVTSIPPPPAPGYEAAAAVQPVRPAAPPQPVDDGYATDDEYGVGAEAAVLVPVAAAAGAAGAAAAAAARQRPVSGTGSKSPWVMFVSANTSSMRLAMGIVAETCKPYDRRSPIWLKVKVRPEVIATAALSVAMSQAQVQERGNVELLVVPLLERKRDEQNRPFNALTWQLIKYGPGAEPGAAATAAAAAAGQQPSGPSAAAMAAAAAAAAKVQAQGDAMIGGTRKLW